MGQLNFNGETGINESTGCYLGGQTGWDYPGGLSQASVKGPEGKVSEHLDLFKTLRNITNLSLADSCPSTSSPPPYHGGNLSALSACLTHLQKSYRDAFVCPRIAVHCLRTTHT